MDIHDCIVVGAGPAGCSAALYAARAGLDVLVLEQGVAGGQITTTETIENYPGVPSISGSELGQRMADHARAAGATFVQACVLRIEKGEDGLFMLECDNADFCARSILVASGAVPRMAGFTGEREFRGRGVSYCATCDAMFFRGKRVFVVGGGNTACEEAIYLARFADSVEIVVRRDGFRAPQGMVDRVLAVENIKIRYLTSIIELAGKGLPDTITWRDNESGRIYTESYPKGSFGIFVFVGSEPMTKLMESYVQLDVAGAVVTDENMATGTPGLFCAGDVRSKPLRQVITAAADGAIAGNAAYRYVEASFRQNA